MNILIATLGPAFVAGFAVQHVIELLDSFTFSLIANTAIKKTIVGIASLVLGAFVTVSGNVRILAPIYRYANTPAPTSGANQSSQPVPSPSDDWDQIVTIVVISAGTEGINSILKLLGYKKEEAKAEAADKKSKTGSQALQTVNKQP
jgi:hypothetical protein